MMQNGLADIFDNKIKYIVSSNETKKMISGRFIGVICFDIE